MKRLSDTQAFTLIELAIVLAVIAIIGAVILPNFMTTTDRARLKSDIQSARILQNAADLYDAEQTPALPRKNMEADIGVLIENEYLPKNAGVIQTAEAKWVYDKNDGGKVKVNISTCNEQIKKLAEGLDEQEKAMLETTGAAQ